MKTALKRYYQQSTLGYYLITPWAKLFQYFLHKKYMGPKSFIQQKFKKRFGHPLDLDNPKSLNEKINWLKLYYTHPQATQMADKYAVRELIRESIGEEYLVPLVFHTQNPNDLVPEKLPGYPVIIKTTHDSSGGVIIRDKNMPRDWKALQGRFRALLAHNFYWDGRERQYKDIPPRIVVEQLLMDDAGNIPADYKVHCFNGRVRMINVDVGRGSQNHFRQWYNREWKLEPYQWATEDISSNTQKVIKPLDKPDLLDSMIRLSENLADEIPYIRIDWYIVGGQLYFGELTFHHYGGMRPIKPKSWDYKLGQQIKLPL